MKSVMQHQFGNVAKAEIPRSVFNRSHGHKSAFDSGLLIPFLVDEALPGDTFNLKTTILARLATPIVPFMDNLFIDTHYFAVPYRLVWDNFQKFMGEQIDPGDSTDYLIPTLDWGGPDTADPESIYDYMGIPTLKSLANLGTNVSSLPLRAYNLIWNEWFRDQNLQDSVEVNRGDTSDDAYGYNLLRRGKRHDYFTSCLPWPQKGPGVELPLGDTAPIVGNSQTTYIDDVAGAASGQLKFFVGNGEIGATGIGASAGDPVYFSNDSSKVGLEADLSGATAATINTIREAFQLQRMLERDARGGSRYIELIKSHFGVSSPDGRMQRPEYLGGKSTPIQVHQVEQQSSTDATTPQGNLAGFAVGQVGNDGFTKSFVEHSIIIGLVSVRADLTYQQGLNRMWSRQTREDHYFPALAHLGEMEVLNQEIMFQGTSADEDVFGYQERWAEYRYKPSIITGKLRSNHSTPLDFWHLSQNFSSLPTLGATFIEEHPPIDRVIAVPSEPEIIFDSYLDLKCTRPMPVYSTPGKMDHF